ncbi:hypothetical protein HanIR_Chr06g0268531 [Helianthus annuus]|nr:hypothetical protein HanIR_Chr06g0268531 [Helianthus annuus]
MTKWKAEGVRVGLIDGDSGREGSLGAVKGYEWLQAIDLEVLNDDAGGSQGLWWFAAVPTAVLRFRQDLTCVSFVCK